MLTIIIPLFLLSTFHQIPSRLLHSLYYMLISSKWGESTTVLQITSKNINIKQMDKMPSLGNIHYPRSSLQLQGKPLFQMKCCKLQLIIAMWQNGDDLQSPMIIHLQEMKLFPHTPTCQASIQQFTSHVDSKKSTRNHHANCDINSQNLVQLAIYHSTNPKATINEVCAHLFNLKNQQHQLPPFSALQGLQPELLLGLTCKIGSTAYYWADLPINLVKQEM